MITTRLNVTRFKHRSNFYRHPVGAYVIPEIKFNKHSPSFHILKIKSQTSFTGKHNGKSGSPGDF